MLCRCTSCNTATNIALWRGVKISNYRCYCGGIFKTATYTLIDGNHPMDPTKTQIGLYGNRKGKPYFSAYKSDGKFFIKLADKFIEIPKT